MKTKVVKSGGRHKGYALYGGQWIMVGWWWDRKDAVAAMRG